MTRKDICKLIRARRRELNKSQKQLATELGMPFQRISEIERGSSNISIDRLINICNALNLKIDINELIPTENSAIKLVKINEVEYQPSEDYKITGNSSIEFNGIEYPISGTKDELINNLIVYGQSAHKQKIT